MRRAGRWVCEGRAGGELGGGSEAVNIEEVNDVGTGVLWYASGHSEATLRLKWQVGREAECRKVWYTKQIYGTLVTEVNMNKVWYTSFETK